MTNSQKILTNLIIALVLLSFQLQGKIIKEEGQLSKLDLSPNNNSQFSLENTEAKRLSHASPQSDSNRQAERRLGLLEDITNFVNNSPKRGSGGFSFGMPSVQKISAPANDIAKSADSFSEIGDSLLPLINTIINDESKNNNGSQNVSKKQFTHTSHRQNTRSFKVFHKRINSSSPNVFLPSMEQLLTPFNQISKPKNILIRRRAAKKHLLIRRGVKKSSSSSPLPSLSSFFGGNTNDKENNNKIVFDSPIIKIRKIGGNSPFSPFSPFSPISSFGPFSRDVNEENTGPKRVVVIVKRIAKPEQESEISEDVKPIVFSSKPAMEGLVEQEEMGPFGKVLKELLSDSKDLVENLYKEGENLDIDKYHRKELAPRVAIFRNIDHPSIAGGKTRRVSRTVTTRTIRRRRTTRRRNNNNRRKIVINGTITIT